MARGPVVRKSAEAVSPTGANSLGSVDHVGTVAVDVAPGTTSAEFAKAMMTSPPKWITTLMTLRDKLVKPFGLKGGHVEATEVTPGAWLGPMRVIDVSDTEVIAGKDDKHLSYRVTFAVREGAHGRQEGACSTVVRYNGASGKWYFAAIRPFHYLIVSDLARRGGAKTTA